MPSPSRATGNADSYDTIATVMKGGIAADLGDFLFRDTGDNYDKPASSYVGATDHATTQISFKAVFIGVNQVKRLAIQTADSTRSESGAGACVSGEFIHPCSALGAAAYRGDYVGPAQGVSTTTLSSNTLEIVATVNKAIGRLAEDAPVGATSLKWLPYPVAYNGGVQAVS